MRRFQHGIRHVAADIQPTCIRRADRHDAGPLAVLAEKTFRDAFAAMNTPANMDAFCRGTYGAAIQAEEISRPDMTTLLFEQDGTPVAFAQLRWGEAPGCVVAGAPAEIKRFYVDRACHGRGVARGLMQACLDELAAHRSDVAWLGVWERNPRAIAFYRKFGFVEVGEQVFPLGSDPQRDIVMARQMAG
jgi:ribosomal protein S18 acetylase RimI-like enzyme